MKLYCNYFKTGKFLSNFFLFFFLFNFQFFFAQEEKELTLDEIIQKNIEVQGGYDLLKSLKNVHLEFSIDIENQTLIIRNYTIHDSITKSEFEIMGQTGYSITTKDKGYLYNPFAGQLYPQEQTQHQINSILPELDIQGHFVDYLKKGHKIELMGIEDVDGIDCYKISIQLKNTDLKMIEYVSKETFLLVKNVNIYTIDNKEQKETIYYSNYEKLPNGLVFPRMIKSSQGILKLTKVEFNIDIPADVFVFPSVEEKKEGQQTTNN